MIFGTLSGKKIFRPLHATQLNSIAIDFNQKNTEFFQKNEKSREKAQKLRNFVLNHCLDQTKERKMTEKNSQRKEAHGLQTPTFIARFSLKLNFRHEIQIKAEFEFRVFTINRNKIRDFFEKINHCTFSS